MKTRVLGKTGIVSTILGFGAMRLPTKNWETDEIDQEKSIEIIRKAIDLGINFVDTAYIYTGSEVVVGKTLQDGYRDRVTLMTKIPTFWLNSEADFDKYLDEQLERLNVKTIDILLFHGLRKTSYDERIIKFNLYEKALQAKRERKIKHIGFSSHDTPENIKLLIDTDKFDIILLQYNFHDRSYEEMINYAAKKGMGVCVMGPLMGGKLSGEPPKELTKFLKNGKKNFSDLGLRFVWSNPNVHIALSGMNSLTMVQENIRTADGNIPISEEEFEITREISSVFKKLSEIKCTGCNYCMPCPNEVNIPAIFEYLIDNQVYGQKENSQISYNNIGKPFWPPGKRADACVECGICEPKCPQNILIIQQLKNAHEILLRT